MKKNENGFTLAELLVSLAIIGAVAALVLPQTTSKMQAHKNVATLAKTVHDVEIGCQRVINYKNDSAGNTSHIDKLMLNDDWKNTILPAMGAREKVAKVAWTVLFDSPAYALPSSNMIGAERELERCTNFQIEERYADGDDSNNLYKCSSNKDFGTEDPVIQRPVLPPIANDPVIDPPVVDDPVINPPVVDDPGAVPPAIITRFPNIGNLFSGNHAQLTLKDSTNYKMSKYRSEFTVENINNTPADKYRADSTAFRMVIDTNGDAKPNTLGKDRFTFDLNNSCKMIPVNDGFTKQLVQNGYKVQ